MAYTAGDLDLTLQSISKDSIDSLEKVIERLTTIKTLIGTTGMGTIAGKLSRSTGSSSSTYNVNKLGKSYLSATTNVTKLGDSTKRVTQRFNEQGKEIKRVTSEIDKYKNKVTTIQDFGEKKSNGLFTFSSFAKIGTFVRSMTRVARISASILQYGVDYTETLNLWQVAMGDNLSMAREFVIQMNKAYGISEKTLMNAQAIFKNMIGSLGQVSETTAYNLSEAITQMAVDYASLYNVSIDAAITKFQAALAGQVRPIRSVSGYDITENTLYQLYQSIGGTKTMRQLSRTEKQLLSIYAIFQQMGASGALGDMEKTIDQVANQSRMMSENWEKMATWAGVSLQYILQQSGAFKVINAILITMGEIFKSIAYALGYEEPDFAKIWAKNVQETEEEIDNLKGKLLGFDKFRSLSGAEENVLGIDEKLLESLSGYTSEIGNATNAARQLANQWLRALGFVDENGDGIYEMSTKAKTFLEIMKVVGTFLLVVFGKAIINSILKFVKGITGITTGAQLLNTVLTTGLLYTLFKAIDAFKKGDKVMGALWLTLSFGFVALKIYNSLQTKSAISTTANTAAITNQSLALNKKLLPSLTKTNDSMITVLSSITAMVAAYGIASGVINSFEGTGKKIASWAFIVVGAIMAVVAAIVAMNTAISWGTMLPVLLAGVGMAIAGVKGLTTNVQMFANGGMTDKGTMFIAGEAGAEMVYNTPSGQSGVANIEQIQQAMYGAMVAYGKTQGNGGGSQPVEVYIDGEKVFQVTQKNARRHGVGFSRL